MKLQELRDNNDAIPTDKYTKWTKIRVKPDTWLPDVLPVVSLLCNGEMMAFATNGAEPIRYSHGQRDS